MLENRVLKTVSTTTGTQHENNGEKSIQKVFCHEKDFIEKRHPSRSILPVHTYGGGIFFSFFLAFPTFDSCCGSGTGKRYWQVPSTLRDVAGRQVGINQRMCVSLFSLFSLSFSCSLGREVWTAGEKRLQGQTDRFKQGQTSF